MHEIDKIVDLAIKSKNPRLLNTIPGIIVLMEKLPFSYCFRYALGSRHLEGAELGISRRFLEVDIPKAKDVAAYIDPTSGKILHVGRVTKEGKIKSQWGNNGPICSHPPELVPSEYGETIRYFRPSASRDISRVPSSTED